MTKFIIEASWFMGAVLSVAAIAGICALAMLRWDRRRECMPVKDGEHLRD